MAVSADNGLEFDERSKRRRRAASESMVTVPIGPALFEVYSGTTSVYLVDLRQRCCACKAFQYNPGDCKHIERVLMTLGFTPIPDVDRVDPSLPLERAKFTGEPVPAADSNTGP